VEKKLPNEELHYFSSSENIIRTTKSIGWDEEEFLNYLSYD
jgi:hypothetical protein